MDYKIYYNDSFIQITDDRSQMNKNFTTLVDSEIETEKFFREPSILFDGVTNRSILFVTEEAGDVMKRFKKATDLVIAGGGIVTNEMDELLLMFRRGKWDLPKGKIEKKEEIIAGAVREVEEETGVKVSEVNKNGIQTFHAYPLKGKNCLKETHWFEMKAKPGQSNLTPQTEEDIEEVRWVKKSDLKNYKDGCYPLIWDLLSAYAAE